MTQTRQEPEGRYLRALAFSALPKTVFIGAVVDPPAVLFATSADSGIDAGKVLKAAISAAGGRGGGSPRLAQGSVPSREQLERVIEEINAAS